MTNLLIGGLGLSELLIMLIMFAVFVAVITAVVVAALFVVQGRNKPEAPTPPPGPNVE